MGTQAQSTTDQIFFAVMELIVEGGISAVTLSAVCKRAGISKGGLMHHYPSKEALVDAFVSRSSEECLQNIEEHLGPIARGSGKRTKAFLDLMLKDPAMCKPESSREIAAIMIALMQGSTTTCADAHYSQLNAQLQGDGIPKATMELVIAAVDGLWLQAAVLPAEQVSKRAEQIRRQLRRIVDAEIENQTKRKAPR